MEIVWLKMRKTMMFLRDMPLWFWNLNSLLRGVGLWGQSLRVIECTLWPNDGLSGSRTDGGCHVMLCFSELDKKANLLKCEYCGKYAPAEQFRGSKRFCSMTCAKRYCRHSLHTVSSDSSIWCHVLSVGSSHSWYFTSPFALIVFSKSALKTPTHLQHRVAR